MPLPRWGRTSSSDPLDALAEWFDRHRGSSRVGLDEEERIRALESRYGVSLPEDFRRYMIDIAPADDLWDDANTIWWAPGRVKNIPDEYEHDISDPAIAIEAGAYLFFADYMIWCWAWAICCSDGPNRGRVAFIGGPDGFVADSFTEFVERYLRDPEATATEMPARTSEL